MKSQRQLQVGERIKRIISDIFLREGLLTMHGNYITILEASISPDIKNARIYIDIFGDGKHNQKILDRLNSSAPHFRFELAKQLTSRNIPEITFMLDETEKKVSDLEKLIANEQNRK